MVLNEVILDWFCLISTKGIGPKTFWTMMKGYGSARESLKHLETPFSKSTAEKILKSMDCEIILANDPLFPKSLRRSSSCPPLLFFKGDKYIFSKRKISIIGARNASIAGRNIAKKLASELSNNFAIVSGLAKGIDTSAHIGSLETPQNKAAIAILPFGFDNIYPRENQRLFEQITENGLVITEVASKKKVDQGMFQARNRIISLISEGIIVIEGAYKSGTMATSQMASDFGCEVMVVPGSPLDPRNQGSNELIKNGAALIQNHFDVLDILNKEDINLDNKIQLEIPKSEITQKNNNKLVLSLLSETPISLDELSFYSRINMTELLCIISELEISGEIFRHSNNEIVLSKRKA